MNILDTVKALLGITNDAQDAILTLYIDIVVQSILNLTNRVELPAELELTAAQMVADMYNEASGSNGTTGKATSISEAGRSVNFDTSAMQLLVQNKLDERKTQLNRFKQLYKFAKQ